MEVKTYVLGPLETNSYLVICEKTGKAVLIDPGDISHSLAADLGRIPLEAIILTHGHFDHIAGIDKVLEIQEVKVMIHPLEITMLQDPVFNGSAYMGRALTLKTKAEALPEKGVFHFGESTLNILNTPGHTPGGVAFEGEGFVVSGDTLFRHSIGRWDFPGGDYDILMDSLKNVLGKLPDETIVYPGHNHPTTIGFEKAHNPYILEE